MSEPKNHHFIPQFMLRRWAVNDGKLVRFYRPRNKVVTCPLAPAAVGYAQHLYTLAGYPLEIRAGIEKKYMGPVVDDPAAKAMDILIAHDGPRLTGRMREAWTRFLMSLWLRTPNALADITAEAEATLRANLAVRPEEYEAVRKDGDPPTMTEWLDQKLPHILSNFGKQLLPQLIDNEKIGTAIIQMKWATLEFQQNFPDLLLGDTPLFRSHGVGDERCVIALPISPTSLFVATPTQAGMTAILQSTGPTLTKAMNETTVAQAARDVFGTTERHLRFVENRLKRADGAVAVN